MRKIICSAALLMFCAASLFAQITVGESESFDMSSDLDSNISSSDSEPVKEQKSENVKRSEIILKFEAAPAGQINTENSLEPEVSYDGAQIADNTGFYLAGEYYFYPVKFLGVGLGAKHQFERHIKNFGELSISNYYLSVKPKLQLKPEAKGSRCKEFVYLIFQCGYGLLNGEYKLKYGGADIPASSESGLYYAGGAGFELNNFIFEFIFNVNESKIKGIDAYSGTIDATYTAASISVGYKIGF